MRRDVATSEGGRGRGDEDPLPRYASLDSLFSDMTRCTRCVLASGRTTVVPGVGSTRSGLMFIGEGPGAVEDREGRPFIGSGGRLLNELMESAGLSRDQAFITNVVACRPPGNRTPRSAEVRAHRPWLEAQIRLAAPRIICTLGRTALEYFEKGLKISDVHGTARVVRRGASVITLMPTFHPAAVLRMRRLTDTMIDDLRELKRLLDGLRG